MTPESKKRIWWIKQNLETRSKWTKLDYQDFYYRDVTFLLGELDRLTAILSSSLVLKRHDGSERPERIHPVLLELDIDGTCSFIISWWHPEDGWKNPACVKPTPEDEYLFLHHSTKVVAWYELPQEADCDKS